MFRVQKKSVRLISPRSVKKPVCKQSEKTGNYYCLEVQWANYLIRYVITQKDFDKAYKIVIKKRETDYLFYK